MGAHSSRIVVTTMKDEGPYVLEWLAYYKLIGFNHFVVFTNDCWDSTAEILETASDALGFVTHIDNTDHGYGRVRHSDPQRRAYFKAASLARVRTADYVLVVDADEFLNIHVGQGTLDDLLDATGPFEAMSLTWKLFGSNFVQRLSDELVMSQFSACLPANGRLLERDLGVKTIFHPRRVEKIGVHRPFHISAIKDGTLPVRWLNGAGQDQYEYYRALKWHASNETDGRTLAEINHYPIKSAEAFLTKMRRGSSNSHDAARANLKYWNNFNHNEVRDMSIQRHAPEVRAQIESWCAQVPELRTLHDEAVAIHRLIAAEMHAILAQEDPAVLLQLGLAL